MKCFASLQVEQLYIGDTRAILLDALPHKACRFQSLLLLVVWKTGSAVGNPTGREVLRTHASRQASLFTSFFAFSSGEGKRNKDQDGFPSFPLIRMAVLILLLFLMASLPFSAEREKQREKGNMKGCERDTWSSLVPSHSLVLYHPPSHPNSRFSSGEGKGRGRERERGREGWRPRKGRGRGMERINGFLCFLLGLHMESRAV